MPVCITARFFLNDVTEFPMYALARAGYSFFQCNRAFREIWTPGTGGTLTSTAGGVFAAAALGILFNLHKHRKWQLDPCMDAGYSFQSATGSNTSKFCLIFDQFMSVDCSLDWRFQACVILYRRKCLHKIFLELLKLSDIFGYDPAVGKG